MRARPRVMAMARAALACASVTLGACHREPTFDERYASAQTALHSEAAGIDAELAARESEAAAADGVEATGTTSTGTR